VSTSPSEADETVGGHRACLGGAFSGIFPDKHGRWSTFGEREAPGPGRRDNQSSVRISNLNGKQDRRHAPLLVTGYR
jgi:hypothetical protein